MLVRELYLINEKGKQYSLMNAKEYCLLTSPKGLGFSYSTSYEQVGSTFVENLRKFQQGQISGELNFRKYENYNKFVDFIEGSSSIKLLYKIPFGNELKSYYKDIQIQGLTKTEKQTTGFITESVVFNCLSLWYEKNETNYTIEELDNEIRWNFFWDSKFVDYNSRSIVFVNNGHIDAPIQVEIDGYVINPKIKVNINGIEYASIKIPIRIEKNQKLVYSTKDTDVYLRRYYNDGTFENLFQSTYININNNNFFKLPKGTSEIVLEADNELLNAKLTILTQYKGV